jgi:hypothetical protein
MWIKDLKVKSEITTGKIGNTLDHIGIGNNFMNKILIAQQLRERIDN